MHYFRKSRISRRPRTIAPANRRAQ